MPDLVRRSAKPNPKGEKYRERWKTNLAKRAAKETIKGRTGGAGCLEVCLNQRLHNTEPVLEMTGRLGKTFGQRKVEELAVVDTEGILMGISSSDLGSKYLGKFFGDFGGRATMFVAVAGVPVSPEVIPKMRDQLGCPVSVSYTHLTLPTICSV